MAAINCCRAGPLNRGARAGGRRWSAPSRSCDSYSLSAQSKPSGMRGSARVVEEVGCLACAATGAHVRLGSSTRNARLHDRPRRRYTRHRSPPVTYAAIPACVPNQAPLAFACLTSSSRIQMRDRAAMTCGCIVS